MVSDGTLIPAPFHAETEPREFNLQLIDDLLDAIGMSRHLGQDLGTFTRSHRAGRRFPPESPGGIGQAVCIGPASCRDIPGRGNVVSPAQVIGDVCFFDRIPPAHDVEQSVKVIIDVHNRHMSMVVALRLQSLFLIFAGLGRFRQFFMGCRIFDRLSFKLARRIKTCARQ